MKKRKLSSAVSLFIVGLLMTLSNGLLAQEEVVPPVLTGEPLTLQNAVEITLQLSTTLETAGVRDLVVVPGALDTGMDGVKAAEANYQIASSQFDTTLSMRANVNHHRITDVGRPFFKPVVRDDTDLHALVASLNKNFRTGIRGSVSVATLSRLDTRSVDIETINTGVLSADVNIPLLKGRGYVSAAARETQTELNYKMSRMNFFHTVSKILLETVKAYWDYRAAVERLKIQEAAEQRVKQWVSEAGDGIKESGGHFSQYSDEIAQLQGYLKYKQKNTLAAMEEVVTTRGTLAKVMGIPSEQMDNIGIPSERFPVDWTNILASVEQRKPEIVNRLVETALNNRFDLKATRLGGESAVVALAKAERDVLPALDLGIHYSTTGIEFADGFAPYRDSLSTDQRGSDLGATLNFSYTLDNRAAEGNLTQAQLLRKASDLNLANAERKTSIEVKVTANIVLGKLRSAVQAKQTVDSYLPSIQNLKNIDLKSNPRAIFDLIALEKRVNEAEASPAEEENSHINSLRELAKAIAQLRFDTGTMVIDGEIGRFIKLHDFTTLPITN